ncbi:suppressor of cytokine signaling 2 isoform X1 [Ornithorhynchus anatinus]|uniref:suppressor of cytokine signaling 2 isoform X1 n=1 Tax=Ornithorhynchus anatinus TaxID=9258 RepID=UPI0019D4A5F6|nr:suppressor of cytokine signaling 2 isoform X1 [Ornithorhynchus anatinus]
MEARGLLLSSSKKPPIPRQRRPRAASSKAGHRGRGRGRGRTSLQGEDVAASSFQCQGLQPAFPGKAAARGTAWSEGPGRTGPPPPPPPGRPPGLPPGPMTLRCPQPRAGSDGSEGAADEQPPEPPGLAKAMRELTHTGWYWGNMTVNEAKEKLKDAPEGTFLIRDSSHSDYLLTISVKTSAGPTNLRIEYQDGKFRLDSIICIKSRLKQFDSVAHLIEYYVRMCKDKRTGSETPRNGTVHLYLTKPLYTSTPSLQHLCRLTINKCTSKIWELPLPTRLKDYLKEYQYQV